MSGGIHGAVGAQSLGIAGALPGPQGALVPGALPGPAGFLGRDAFSALAGAPGSALPGHPSGLGGAGGFGVSETSFSSVQGGGRESYMKYGFILYNYSVLMRSNMVLLT